MAYATMADLTTTTANNSPAGTDNANTADDVLRAHAAIIRDSMGTIYAAGGTADAITATVAPAITAYFSGHEVVIKTGASANTGAVTINLNSLGTKAVVKGGTTALVAGDLLANTVYRLKYDGTSYQVVGGSASQGTFLQSGTGAAARSVTARLQEEVYVEDFGAVGDDSTLNDTAFDNARAASIESGKALRFGPGIFRISASFDIEQYTEWAIKGDTRGGTIIRQVTDNTPIIKITGNLSWGWSITDVKLDYVSAQPSANTLAIGIYFDGTTASQQVWNFLIDRVTFDKGYLAIASNSSKQLAVWGFEIGQILVNSSTSGGALRLTQSVSWGQPSIFIRQLYARCDSMTLPMVEINAANGLVINSIEGNILPNIALLKLTTCIGAHIGEAKIEVATYTSSDSRAIEYSNSDVHFGSLILGLSEIAVGAGNEFYALYQAGGVAGRIKVDTLQCNAATLTSGKAYVVRSSNAANQVVIGRITTMTNFELTDTSATGGADGLTVESWANQLVSADKGDANVTFTMGDECVVRFGTTLTANRNFTLPVANTAVGACSSFNGHRITVLRDAATPGDFTLTIKNSAGVTLYTIPSGTKQAVDLVWSRVSGGAYRVLRAVTLT